MDCKTLVICIALAAAGHTVQAAETVTVRLTDSFGLVPEPVLLQSPSGDSFAGNFTLVLSPTGPAQSFSASVGTTTLNVPAWTHMLNGLTGQAFPCGTGGMCTVTSTVPSSLWTDDLGPFPVTLNTPLPDPQGGCANVSGQVNGPWNQVFALPAGAAITALPSVGALNPVPGQPPLPPVPQVFFASPVGNGGMTITPQPTLHFQVCGDPENGRVGTLSYDADIKGNDWEWRVAGKINVLITDNGYTGSAHTAELSHQQTQNSVSGLLLSVTDPAFPAGGELPVTRIENDAALADYQMDPASYDEPEPAAYRIQFHDMRGSGGKHILTFAETPNPVHMTGRQNEQPFPNMAAIALGQWMRRNGDESLALTAAVTGDQADSWSVPVGQGMMNLSWTLNPNADD